MSESGIDEAIVSVTTSRWTKVAMVIIRTERELGLRTDHFQIAERIESLVLAGHLLVQGDIKQWRFSEVRKP